MVPVNKGVGWAAIRTMDTNQQHPLQGYGPILHPKSANLRHTFQFPHQSASNFCTFSGTDALKVMVPVNNSVGWVPRRSMDTKELHRHEGYGPTLHLILSDLRHTSQLPHHNVSNFCTFS